MSEPIRPVPSTGEPPLTVGELTLRIQQVLEGELGRVFVTGEVSNVRRPTSGHCYFVLKDGEGALNAICFRRSLAVQPIRPVEGMQVDVRGRVTAYRPRSQYQVIVESMREAGLGALMRRFLELKERLKAEGLFEEALKQPIPRMPRRIGVITSATGAALRDIANVLARRARGLEIVLASAAVQGESAPPELVRAFEWIQRHGRAEVIIVGRGGGSIEDLWAFNDERVVRAIVACPIPVISAVGHQTDTTLADYGADVRAPTPSAAAELVTAHYGELAERMSVLGVRMERAMRVRWDELNGRLGACVRSWGLRRPPERLELAMQRLDDVRQALEVTQASRLREAALAVDEQCHRLARVSPGRRLELARMRLGRAGSLLAAAGPGRWRPRIAGDRRVLAEQERRLRAAAEGRLERGATRLEHLGARLAAVSPRAVLERGYSIVSRGRRLRVVSRPEQVRPHEVVRIESAGGVWRAAALPPGEDLFENLE